MLPRQGEVNRNTSRVMTCSVDLLWLQYGSGRCMPKTLLRPTMTCRTVHLGTILELGCVRRGQCL